MLRIVTQQAEAQAELRRIRDRTRDEHLVHQQATVREVLQTVRRQGDAALLRYAAEFEQQSLEPSELQVSGLELEAAYQQISKSLLNSIQLARHQMERFHRQRVPHSWVQFGDRDVVLGKRYQPVEGAGLYIPGGWAPYPSLVLMCAIPAQVAGVRRIVMVSPPRAGKTIHPAVLVAAQEAGVHEIYRVGGPQAIAALAYGTATIPPVDMIAGPGDIYVTLAKKLVHGIVGVDALAGPSEMMIIADGGSRSQTIAADLLAQAEYSPMAAAILLTPDASLANQVAAAVGQQLVNHPRRTLTEKAIAHYGLVVQVDSLETAVDLVNGFAPGQVSLAVADPWSLLGSIRHAGSILMGYDTPEAVAGFLAGPSAILPPAWGPRYASALGVETFLKQSQVIQYSPAALRQVAGAIDFLATLGELPCHAEAVRLRLQNPED